MPPTIRSEDWDPTRDADRESPSEPGQAGEASALHGEEGDFSDDDWAASDRAWAKIASGEADEDDEDYYTEDGMEGDEPDPDLDRLYAGTDDD
jgi:hypothetical protein